MRPASFASRRDQTSIDSIDPSSAANIRWLEARAINLFPVRFWGNPCAADGTRQRLNETDFPSVISVPLCLKFCQPLSVRVPMKPAMHSNSKPAGYSNRKPATLGVNRMGRFDDVVEG
jgi:hypothetical protein